MSHSTRLKMLRKENPELENDPQFKIDTAQGVYTCPVCGKPMYLSVGQIQAAHGGDCKKKFKEWERFQKKNRDKLKFNE